MYRFISFTILIGAFTFFAAETARSQINESTGKERRDAQLAWEALVKVKGGRERLESISNIRVTSFYLINGKKTPVQVKLMVLPHFVWKAGYHLDGSPTLYRSDSSKPIQIWADMNGITDSNANNPRHFFSVERLIYLLETKHERPQPLRVRSHKNGRKKYDVIETSFDDERLDFYYEPEDMLVTEVVILYKDGTVRERYKFSGYTVVDGIQVPQKVNLNINDWDTIKLYSDLEFEFNVDYAPDLFTRPPKATMLDAWKKQ